MLRKFILSLTSLVCFGMAAQAQTSVKPCGTDEQDAKLKALYPKIITNELDFQVQLEQQLQRMDLSQFARKGAGIYDDVVYDVPVVVHIIHNYNTGAAGALAPEYLSDNEIYNAVDNWNKIFLKQSADTAGTIAPYAGNIRTTYNVDSNGNPAPITPVRYIGKTNIRFHLATKDPTGKPTTGITRTRSSLYNIAGDQAKLNQWAPGSYLNIWVIQRFGEDKAGVAAYTQKPATAAEIPFYDGLITLAEYFDQSATIPHEIGHYLGLSHVWGNTNSPEVACGDDGVDDTPPTKGHNPPNGSIDPCAPSRIYDTLCTINFRDTLGRRSIEQFMIPKFDTLNYLGIDFQALTNFTIDTVTIYPAAPLGSSFEITLRKYGFPYATYNGTVTTNNGPQKVPVNFSVTADSGYLMVMTQNPGMLRDLVPATPDFTTELINRVKFISYQNGGYYNYFYNWKTTKGTVKDSIGKPRLESAPIGMTHDGVCFQTFSSATIENVYVYPAAPRGTSFTINLTQSTPEGSVLQSFTDTVKTPYARQAANLGFKIQNAGKYCLSLGDNPGMLRPEFEAVAYNKEIPAVIRINKDTTTAGTGSTAHSYYNYFFNMAIRHGYAKLYVNSLGGDSVVDYPDTANAQNIMDYTYCDKMFTYGQTRHMRAGLLSPTANRSNLFSTANLIGTGVWADASGTLAPRPDLKPIPDFNVSAGATNSAQLKVFACADGLQNFYFKDRSWRDTITNWNWTFSNGATTSTSNEQNVVNRFTEPGWVTTTLTVTGNNTGDSSFTNNRSIYVADTNSMYPIGYWQEFGSEEDMAKWPIFNYYNDPNHQWEPANVGYYDSKAIMFKNYDNRDFPAFVTGSPLGQYADFYTPAFNISGSEFSDNANLNFMSAGAFRTSVPTQMNDTLEIAYSTDCGTTWTPLTRLTRGDLGNYGPIDVPFAPLYQGDWKAQSINLPGLARKARVFFRFRYKVGISKKMTLSSTGDLFASYDYFKGTGNNFYLDRISISNNPLGIAGEVAKTEGITVAPNPTSGSAMVTIAGGQGEAVINVTDITGKVVFQTRKQLNAQGTQVEIPASNISAKGMYLVQVVANGKAQTQKLVVY